MMSRRVPTLCVALLGVSVVACRAPRAQDASAEHGDGWSVTAWGERYEVFAETDGLVAGRSATSNPHVTVLAGFQPLRAGRVTIVLRATDGREQAFRADTPKREGIFPIEIQAMPEGTFDLFFRVESAAGREEIPAGRVRAGSPGSPGGPLDATSEAPAGAVSFLKEQQWRTAFATAWTEEGSLHDSVSGPARVRPAGGGDVLLTAPADSNVAPEPWPHVGLEIAKGATFFRLVPRVGDRSLPDVQADVDALAADVNVARRRVERLNGLLDLEATSSAEVERAQATLAALQARLDAARQGVNATKTPDALARYVTLKAPWAGRVAEVFVSPGQTVEAGAALGRIVRVRPLWIEAALRPEDAARLTDARVEVHLRRPGQAETLAWRDASARLIARAPELDARTATQTVTLEVDVAADELPIGSFVEADLLLPDRREGVVVPLSAVVQDSGASVVYVQLAGETFARRDARVLVRSGRLALVDGLRPRERVVTVGAAAVRRSSLLSSGAPEGHVH